MIQLKKGKSYRGRNSLPPNFLLQLELKCQESSPVKMVVKLQDRLSKNGLLKSVGKHLI